MSKKRKMPAEKTKRKKLVKYSSNIIKDRIPTVNSIKTLIEIGRSLKIHKNINTKMLWNILPYLEQLDDLVGMESLKETILLQVMYYLKGFHVRNNNEYLHTMIMGPPGTGKTTVALIIAHIYQGMGVLSEDGPIKMAHRDDFIAGYTGQTALKTKKLLNSCLGGVLFVDEVYSLGSDTKNDTFSKEAYDTITAFLSEHKNDFCFIGAGYESEIDKCFFGSNKGLRSRFQWTHRILKYSDENLADIMLKMIKSIAWNICIEKKYLIELINANINLFSNYGRDVEIFLSKIKMYHAKRVFSLENEHMFVLMKKDFEGGIEMMKKLREEKDENETNISHLSMYT